MPNKIERKSSVTESFTLTSDPATSPKIPYAASAGGVFIVDAMEDAASITWSACFGGEGVPAVMNNSAGPVTTTIAVANAYPIPDELFGSEFIVGTTNEGTAVIRLCVKT